MKFKIFFIPIFLSFISLSCKKENVPNLDGCCNTPAIETSFGNAHVYVPNIFTPNDDGRNDELYIIGDSVSRIISFSVRDNQGDVVAEIANINFQNFKAVWDGRVDGQITIGLYDISMILMSENGILQTLEGKVCNYPCERLPVSPIQNLQLCQFPVQVINGIFEPSIPSGEETSCFE